MATGKKSAMNAKKRPASPLARDRPQRPRSDSTVSLESIMSDMDTVCYSRSNFRAKRNIVTSPTDLFFRNPIQFGVEVNAHERTSPALPSERQMECFRVFEKMRKYTKSLTLSYVPDYGEISKLQRSAPSVSPHLQSHMMALFAAVLESKSNCTASQFVRDSVLHMIDEPKAQKKAIREAFGALNEIQKRTSQSQLIRPVALDHFDTQERKHTQAQAVTYRKSQPFVFFFSKSRHRDLRNKFSN